MQAGHKWRIDGAASHVIKITPTAPVHSRYPLTTGVCSARPPWLAQLPENTRKSATPWFRRGLPCSAMSRKLAAMGVRTVGMHSGSAVVVGLRMRMAATRPSRCVCGGRHKAHQSNQQERERQVSVESHPWSPPDCSSQTAFHQTTYMRCGGQSAGLKKMSAVEDVPRVVP